MSRLSTIFLLFNLSCTVVLAQQEPVRDSTWSPQDTVWTKQDSLLTLKDSLKYKAIESYSKKFKITRFIHGLLFRPVTRPVVKLPAQNVKPHNPDFNAQGKVIRNIRIDVLDPFGYSIHDTSRQPKVFVMTAGNKLHVKTRDIVIYNLLLFDRYDSYDSLLVNESERLIRAQKYIHDVRFYTIPVSKSDSVDIYVRALDIWSIVPALSVSGSFMELGLTDNNFSGLGSMFQAEFQKYRKLNDYVTRLKYAIPNIRNSYISANIQYLFSDNMGLIDSMKYSNSFYSPISANPQYSFENNQNIIRSLELSRSFYTPGVKWAGGIFLGQMITSLNYIRNDTMMRLPARTNIQDYWGARSWQIDGRAADGRITNFIFSLRMLRTRYPRIEQLIGPSDYFNRENIYFAGIAITSRKYIRDRYIFNYGKIEDVPAGTSFGLTIGLDDVHKANRWYIGIKAAWGDYHPGGYLSTHLEFGTLKGPAGFQQGVFSGRIDYFTPLLDVGTWKIRQFVRPAFTFGINRLQTDNLTLNNRMKGFEKLNVPAIHNFVLSLQTQSYSPWNLVGFRFGPYFFSSFGILGNATQGFKNSKVYSLFGLGFLVRNDYLLFNTFQLSLTFYPFVPERGFNILKTNAYQTYDYGFQNFEIAKPEVVEYR